MFDSEFQADLSGDGSMDSFGITLADLQCGLLYDGFFESEGELIAHIGATAIQIEWGGGIAGIDAG